MSKVEGTSLYEVLSKLPLARQERICKRLLGLAAEEYRRTVLNLVEIEPLPNEEHIMEKLTLKKLHKVKEALEKNFPIDDFDNQYLVIPDDMTRKQFLKAIEEFVDGKEDTPK